MSTAGECLAAFVFGSVVGLLVLLWMSSALLSASPELHHWLHADSQQAGHECILTLLSHGHAWRRTIPPTLFKDHPDYFAMREGERIDPVNGSILPGAAQVTACLQKQ